MNAVAQTDLPLVTAAATVSIDVIAESLQAAIKPERKGRKRSAQAGKQALRALDTESWPLNARWVYQWFYHLLHDRKRKMSTVERYAFEVLDDILIGGVGIDFQGFDTIDFENFYQRALDRSHQRKDLAFKAGRLDDLHSFGVSTFDFARLPEPLRQQSNASHVRAIVMPEVVFAQGRDRVLEVTEIDGAGRQCLWVLLTVLHRAGLRRSDALSLRIADLDPGATFWIRITDNEYADTKRSKSRIPLTPLLLPEERERVHEFLYDRLRSGDGGSALVFHPSGAPKQPWNGDAFRRLYGSLIRCGLTGRRYTPHDSRHTCVSQLQLVMADRTFWTAALTPYSEEQSREIRAALFSCTESGKNDYWSLAALMSHGSPQTTFNSYLHYSHLLLFEGIRHMEAPLSFNQMRNLGGVTARIVNRWQEAAGSDAQGGVSVNVLDSPLSAELEGYAINVTDGPKVIVADDSTSELYRAFKPSTEDIEVAYPALTRHFVVGTPISVLSRTLGIWEEVIATWIDNCEFIGSLRTRKRHSGALRHVSVSRRRDGILLPLPPKPRHISELQLLPGLYAAVEQSLLASREKLRDVCAYWLTHSTVSNSGLPLNDPAVLDQILSLFASVLPASCWRLRLLVPTDEDVKSVQQEWNSHPGLHVEVRRAQPKRRCTSVWLYLRHPDEKSLTTMTRIAIRRQGEEARLPRKFSSQLLRYLLHMTAIVAFETAELHEMVDTGTD